jgi:hypothetical protein
MVRVEGFDLDQTMGGLQDFIGSGASSVTLVLKRLVKRETLTVRFVGVGFGGACVGVVDKGKGGPRISCTTTSHQRSPQHTTHTTTTTTIPQ